MDDVYNKNIESFKLWAQVYQEDNTLVGRLFNRINNKPLKSKTLETIKTYTQIKIAPQSYKFLIQLTS